MLLMQQFNAPLPERPRGVHELRAALLSVYLHTDPRGDASYALTPAMQPLSLPSAIKEIQTLSRRHQESALPHAAFKLASATYVERTGNFTPDLTELIGPDRMRALEARINGSARSRSPTQLSTSLTNLELRQIVTRVVRGQDSEPVQDTEGGQQQDEFSEQPLLITQAPLPGEPPESTLDLSTLTTTVDISSMSNLSIGQLATLLDPRSWSKSPFWLQSVRVDPDKTGLGFEFHPIRSQTPPIGQSWKGFLFEQVEWNWNTTSVSSFNNILKIDFQVARRQRKINMTFSLHSCEGSQLYAMVSKRGVDIDFGFQSVEPPGDDGAGLSQIRTQKNVRFSDTLNRRTPFEGAAGSGAMLRYLAPALVGLWMNDLLLRLNA